MRYILSLVLMLSLSALVAQNHGFVDVTNTAGTNKGPDNNGVVVGDYDNDGFEDIFVPSRLGPNRLYRNMGNGTFEDVTAVAGLEPQGLTMTGSWGDIDNDGDLDLFIGNYSTPTSFYNNYLYLNNGDGTFTDISEAAGVDTHDQTRSIHMVDLDLDGYLDIYVCNLLQQNTLWHNNGDNTFSNTIFTSGLGDTNISMGAIFFDYDNDNDLDVYLTHDGNQQYIMYENDGTGRFTDVSVETGLDVAGQGMGVDHGDINNDGHLDIYVTNLGPNFLLLNNGQGSYTEVAESANALDEGGMGWGCFFVDYDNDGWDDIYVINDSRFSPATNKLYKNNGNGTFLLVSEMTPVSSFFAGRGGTWADFNNDGFLDIAVANNEDNIGVQIFENTNTENNWIAFDLEGTSVSLDAYGSRVQVKTAQGVKIEEKSCGISYASQSSHRVYFGLGQGEAEEILVTWPDGSQDFFDKLDINQIHFIKQGSNPVVAPVDADMDGFTSDVDCDDNNPEVYPGAFEVANNDVDEDCDGVILIIDDDGDGYHSFDDCDDNDPNVNPGVVEIPNNDIDENCDGVILIIDEDGDGFNSDEDCDDSNAAINPDQTEVTYNGIDDDCDEMTLDDDLDQDGFLLADDCNDLDGNINPDAIEIPNNDIDEDCDGFITATQDLADTKLQIFPNPARDYVNLKFDKIITATQVQILNIQGQLLASLKINEEQTVIDVSHLEGGIYLLKINRGKSQVVQLISIL